MLIKKEKGFTPLEVQRRFLINFWLKAKPILSITKRSEKPLTGFTLTELLVVVSIIGLLSVTVFANYRAGERQYALQRSAHKLAQDIRRAQAMTMGAVECPPETTCAGEVPPGYGIYLEQNNEFYILYADTTPVQGNQQYDEGDALIEKIYFEKGVYIASANPASLTLSINFKPPDPVVRIRGSGGDVNEATMTIALRSDPSKSKTIEVNKAGLIEIK